MTSDRCNGGEDAEVEREKIQKVTQKVLVIPIYKGLRTQEA